MYSLPRCMYSLLFNNTMVMANSCFTPFFTHIWLYMAVSFHSWRNKVFLGVKQQHSVSSCQRPLMGLEPQRRGTSSLKAERLNHSPTEVPHLPWYSIADIRLCGMTNNASAFLHGVGEDYRVHVARGLIVSTCRRSR